MDKNTRWRRLWLALMLCAAVLLVIPVQGRPASFSLLRPYNGENVGTSTPTFEWESADGASWYGIQIDNDSDFSSPLYDNENVGNTTVFTLPAENALPDGVYYWRAYAENQDGATESDQSYRFRVDTLSPEPPSLLWPANNDNINDNSPNLDWDAPPENSLPLLFHVQVSSNQYDWNPPYLVENQIVTDDNFQCSELQDNVYYWRVRARDNAGNWGNFPPYRSFRVDTVPPPAPTLLSPSSGAMLGSLTVQLEWSTVTDTGSGVANYWIQVDTESAFTPPLIENLLVADSSCTITLPDSGQYYWRVRAIDHAGNKSDTWSPLGDFTVHIWKSVEAWASSSLSIPKWKEMDAWKGSKWSEASWLEAENWTTMIKEETWWHVIEFWAGSAYTLQSHWTLFENWSAVPSAPVLPPMLVAPRQGENLGDNTPTLAWENFAPADNFEIQVDESAIFSSPLELVSYTTTVDASPALSDGVYYWRVRTNRNGLTSAWSVSKSFRVDTLPPSPPSLVAPENKKNENDSTPWLFWSLSLIHI